VPFTCASVRNQAKSLQSKTAFYDRIKIESQIFQEIAKTQRKNNIIGYHGTSFCTKSFSILLKLELGILDLLALGNYVELKLDQITYITHDICQGVNCLHSMVFKSFVYIQNIMHNDLKTQNVTCVVEGGRSVFKICDYGVSCISGVCPIELGTLGYLAPEYFDENVEVYGLPSDIWALGILILYMRDNWTAFDDISEENKRDYLKGRVVPPAPENALVPDSILDKVLKSCLVRDPARRSSADVVLAVCLLF
jgi:serine/threonine protein kinase